MRFCWRDDEQWDQRGGLAASGNALEAGVGQACVHGTAQCSAGATYVGAAGSTQCGGTPCVCRALLKFLARNATRAWGLNIGRPDVSCLGARNNRKQHRRGGRRHVVGCGQSPIATRRRTRAGGAWCRTYYQRCGPGREIGGGTAGPAHACGDTPLQNHHVHSGSSVGNLHGRFAHQDLYLVVVSTASGRVGPVAQQRISQQSAAIDADCIAASR